MCHEVKCYSTFAGSLLSDKIQSYLLCSGSHLAPTRNIYLHYSLDLWLRRGFALGRVKRPGPSHSGMPMTLWSASSGRVTQRGFESELDGRLGKFGLEVAPEKTKILEFGPFAVSESERQGVEDPETFDFLGLHPFLQHGRKTAELSHETRHCTEEVQSQAAGV